MSKTHFMESISQTPSLGGHFKKKSAEGPSFGDIFSQFIGGVNQLQKSGDAKIQEVATGKATSLEEVMVTMNEAKQSFELMLEIRNKLLQALEQLQRM